MPASMSTWGPSAKGKNASDAAIDPAARSPARSTARRHESTRFTCPMPMPTVAEFFARTMAFDFTARHDFHAKMRFVISSSLGRSPETSSQSFATDSMSSGNRSASWSSRPPDTRRTSMLS